MKYFDIIFVIMTLYKNTNLKDIQKLLDTDNALSIFQDLLGFSPRNKQVVRLFDETKSSSEAFREAKDKYPARVHNYQTYEHYTAVNAYMRAYGLKWKEAVIELGKQYGHLPHDYDSTPFEKRAYTPKAQPTEQERREASRLANPSFGAWSAEHLAYWQTWHITQPLLEQYGVKPLQSFDLMRIETGELKCTMTLKELAYGYELGKAVKKYQPQSKKYKWQWIGENTQSNILWGLEQLPEKCAKIVIVEGLKDAMAVVANFSEFGIYAVGLDSAGQKISANDLESLKSKVSNPNDVFLCLDNDPAGKKGNAEKAKKCGLSYLPYKAEFVRKDFADLVDTYEKFVIKEWLLNGAREGLPTQEAKEEANNENTPKKLIHRLEGYLCEKYAFRINTVTDQIEIKKHSEQDYVLLTDIVKNSIVREIKHNTSFKKVGKSTIEDLFKSDFSPLFNPFHAYFENLPTCSGTSHITALAKTLTVGEGKEAYFLKCLTKWLVATVANIFNHHKCENHTCLVLTGAQGIAKTTWLDNLCPPKLKSYLYTGRIVIDEGNDNTLRALNTCFIINIDDQLKKLNHKDEEGVKTLITLPKCRYRRLYSNIIEDLPRNASFVASVNGYDFLTDMTGSRRFLPFEAKAVNREALQKIDMDLVWAEAYTLYKGGSFQWWFDASEIAELEGNNNPFAFQSLESELLFSHYSPTPLYEGQEPIFMQTGEILLRLQETAKGQRLGSKKMGSVLGKHFERIGKKLNGLSKYGYNLYPNIGSVNTETGELTDYSENFKN